MADNISNQIIRLNWVDQIKAVAIIWIFFNHVTERLFGYPLITNPTNTWLTITDRITQLIPLHGSGLWDIPINMVRYIGWAGDQGVQLFLILSGFAINLEPAVKKGGQNLRSIPILPTPAFSYFSTVVGNTSAFYGVMVVHRLGIISN